MTSLQIANIKSTVQRWTAEVSNRRKAYAAAPWTLEMGQSYAKTCGYAANFAGMPGRVLLGDGLAEPGRTGLAAHGLLGTAIRRAGTAFDRVFNDGLQHNTPNCESGLAVANTILAVLRLVLVTAAEAVCLSAAMVFNIRWPHRAEDQPPHFEESKSNALPQSLGLQATEERASTIGQADLDVVENYFSYVLRDGSFASDVVAKALGAIFNVNIRIWSRSSQVWTTGELYTHWQDGADKTLDLLRYPEHYCVIDTADVVNAQAREGTLTAGFVEANKTDAGGGGNCLYLAVAYGLDYQGFAQLHDAHRRCEQDRQGQDGPARDVVSYTRRATETVRHMRRQVVDSWRPAVEAMRSGADSEAQTVVDQIIRAAEDEGLSVIFNAQENWSDASSCDAQILAFRGGVLARASGLLTQNAASARDTAKDMIHAIDAQLAHLGHIGHSA